MKVIPVCNKTDKELLLKYAVAVQILPLAFIATLLTKHPGLVAGMNLMGTFFYLVFLVLQRSEESEQRGSSFTF